MAELLIPVLGEGISRTVFALLDAVSNSAQTNDNVPHMVYNLFDRAEDFRDFLQVSLRNETDLSKELDQVEELAKEVKTFLTKMYGRHNSWFSRHKHTKSQCDLFHGRFNQIQRDIVLKLLLTADVRQGQQRAKEDADRQLQFEQRVRFENSLLAIENDLKICLDQLRHRTTALDGEQVDLVKDLVTTLKKNKRNSPLVNDAEEVLTACNPEETLTKIDNNAFDIAEEVVSKDEVEFERKIGEGGFGEVWVVRFHGQRRAAKRLQSRSDEALWREIRLQYKANHEFVSRIFGHVVLTDPSGANHRYLLAEYAVCGDLRLLLDAFKGSRARPRTFKLKNRSQTHKACLSLAVVAMLLREISLGIEHIDFQGLMHRDIKPENIVLKHGCIPQIADFGSAKGGGTNNHTSHQGTYFYQAPETKNDSPLPRNLRYNNLCDVYSFGAIMHETIHAMQGEVPSKDVPFSSSTRCEHLEALEKIRRQCLHKTPRQRFGRKSSSMALMSDAFEDVLTAMGGSPRTAECTNHKERRNLIAVSESLEALQCERLQGDITWTNCVNENTAETDGEESLPSVSSLSSSYSSQVKPMLDRIDRRTGVTKAFRSLSSDTILQEHHHELATQGGPKILLDAMKANEGNAYIQARGAVIFCRLLNWGADYIHPEGFLLLDVLVTGMKRHDDQSFLLHAALAIKKLCCDNDSGAYRDYAGKKGALDALSNTLRSCSGSSPPSSSSSGGGSDNNSNEELQDAVCGAIVNVCRRHQPNKARMTSHLGDIVTCIAQCNEAVKPMACLVVYIVTSLPCNCQVLADLGVIPHLLKSIEISDDARAWGALARLLKDDSNIQARTLVGEANFAVVSCAVSCLSSAIDSYPSAQNKRDVCCKIGTILKLLGKIAATPTNHHIFHQQDRTFVEVFDRIEQELRSDENDGTRVLLQQANRLRRNVQ